MVVYWKGNKQDKLSSKNRADEETYGAGGMRKISSSSGLSLGLGKDTSSWYMVSNAPTADNTRKAAFLRYLTASPLSRHYRKQTYTAPPKAAPLTSKLCAYHSFTVFILGILFSPSGRPSSSTTLCDSLIGNSSERNCEALRSVPCDGFWPKRIICWRETGGQLQHGMPLIANRAFTHLRFEEKMQNGGFCPIMRKRSWTSTWRDATGAPRRWRGRLTTTLRNFLLDKDGWWFYVLDYSWIRIAIWASWELWCRNKKPMQNKALGAKWRRLSRRRKAAPPDNRICQMPAEALRATNRWRLFMLLGWN